MPLSYEEVVESKGFLPLHLDHLTPRMVQIAKNELNEMNDTRQSSIEQLRKLIRKEKNLKCQTNDEYLLKFLRARKFNVKQAFARLQSFYTVSSKTFSDVYQNTAAESIRKVFRTEYMSHLPYRDREGAAIVLIKMSGWKTDEVDAYSILNCCTAGILAAADEPASQVCGIQLLIDVRGTTLQQLRCLGPRFLYLFAKGLRDTLPVRFKGIHLINASAAFQYLWSIINVFLSDKLRKRVQSHDDNLDSLHKFIPKEILPTEYGGENTSFDPAESGATELEKFFPKYLQISREGYITK